MTISHINNSQILKFYLILFFFSFITAAFLCLSKAMTVGVLTSMTGYRAGTLLLGNSSLRPVVLPMHSPRKCRQSTSIEGKFSLPSFLTCGYPYGQNSYWQIVSGGISYGKIKLLNAMKIQEKIVKMIANYMIKWNQYNNPSMKTLLSKKGGNERIRTISLGKSTVKQAIKHQSFGRRYYTSSKRNLNEHTKKTDTAGGMDSKTKTNIDFDSSKRGNFDKKNCETSDKKRSIWARIFDFEDSIVSSKVEYRFIDLLKFAGFLHCFDKYLVEITGLLGFV